MESEIIYNCPQKEYNGKLEILKAIAEMHLFKILFVMNEQKRYCYGCKYSFTNNDLKSKYDKWLIGLSVNDLRQLKNF